MDQSRMRAKFSLNQFHKLTLSLASFAVEGSITTFSTMNFFRPLISLLMLAVHIQAQDEKFPLRPHWETGKLYRQETFTDTGTRKPGETATTQSMRVVQITEMTVSKDKNSPDRWVNVRFVSVKGEIAADGKTLTFDSSNPTEQNPMLMQAFGRAIGKSFTLVYDEQDRFRDIRDLSSLASESGAVTGLAAVADSRDVANLFRKSLDMGLPPVPVALGDTWSADETIAFPKAGEVRVRMNGKLEAIEEREGRKHAKIAFSGKFGNTADRSDKPASLVEITNDSSMAGILLFDLERRVVSFGAYTTSIKLQAPGQLIPFEQKVTSKITAIEDAPKK
jgi:hypothetical protein